jgi:hypothetical protein
MTTNVGMRTACPVRAPPYLTVRPLGATTVSSRTDRNGVA